jgi:hypothetical protein
MPSDMPSIRMFGGLMQFLLSRLDKLEDNLVRFGLALAAINAQLQSRPMQHASLGGRPKARPKAFNNSSFLLTFRRHKRGFPLTLH